MLLSVLVAASLLAMLYPTVSDWWNSLHQSRAMASYAESEGSLDEGTCDALLAEARSYNAGLLGDAGRFSPSEEERREYEGLLAIEGTSVIGTIEIEKIGCSLPIYHGTDASTLQVGVGYFEGSSLPVGGPGTHAVITGHRGLPSARLFTDLDRLEVGDTFVIHVLDETLTYEVDQVKVVDPDDADDLAIEEGKDLCTLLTCTPYGINSHRLLVRGHRVSNQEAGVGSAGEGAWDVPLVALLGAIALALVLVAVVVARKARDRAALATGAHFVRGDARRRAPRTKE